MISARIRARWPNIWRLHWASTGALIGLSVPSIYGYSAMPYEMTSGAKDAGQDVGIFLGLFGPMGGGLLALIGWFTGLGISQRLRNGDEGS